jgi:hypothetical protein
MPVISPGPPSPVSDFVVETAVVELPRKGVGGKTLAVKIRSVSTVEIVKALQGVPELNRGPGGSETTLEQAREIIVNSEGPNRKLAQLGIIEPAFSFGDAPEQGKAFWPDLHSTNQAALIQAILEFSGWGQPATPAAAEAESFRGVVAPEGVGSGGAGGGSR